MNFQRSISRDSTKARVTGKPGNPDNTTALKLVDKAAGGDCKAFGKIYDIYLERIYRYVYYKVNDKMIAEDLTEEIFVKAWGTINKYEQKGQPFSAWLYRIAHNHTVDFYRTTKREARLQEQATADIVDPVREIEEKSKQRELLKAISGLTDKQQQVITLKFIENLDNHEIALITGMNEGAIRATQMRALVALRKKLDKEIDN